MTFEKDGADQDSAGLIWIHTVDEQPLDMKTLETTLHRTLI